MAHTIGIDSPLLPQDAKLSFMNLLPTEDHGAAVVQMDGTSGLSATITVMPDTRAYQISGLAKLFPQHCQVPCLT
jgi:hypothetical protein